MLIKWRQVSLLGKSENGYMCVDKMIASVFTGETEKWMQVCLLGKLINGCKCVYWRN